MAYKDLEKRKQYKHAWYQANRDPIQERVYRLANKDRIENTRQTYVASNREKIKKQKQDYYLKNREKILAALAVKRAADPEKVRQDLKKWRDANLEHARDLCRQSYAKHASKRQERGRQWRSEHPEKIAQYYHERRGRERNASGNYSLDQLHMRNKLFGDCCAYCGGPNECSDHVIPLARGGTNWPANLRPSCHKCNRRKNAQDWRKWAPRL